VVSVVFCVVFVRRLFVALALFLRGFHACFSLWLFCCFGFVEFVVWHGSCLFSVLPCRLLALFV
jgi:hypothetical protein